MMNMNFGTTRTYESTITYFDTFAQCITQARRTLELSAELTVSPDRWRKLFPQVCGVVFCAIGTRAIGAAYSTCLIILAGEKFSSQCARNLRK
jgi:hypothetical protein